MAVFGLHQDAGPVGNQYSFVGSIAPIAQLAWQPYSSVLTVKVPQHSLMPPLVLGWGIAQTAMAACHNYSGLLATRFFLGLFEAGCLPLFGIITNQWYHRSERPIRVAAWYGMNGMATIIASALSYGLGHIPSHTLYANACAPRFPHGEDNPNSCVRSYDVQNLPICRPRVQFAMQGCQRHFRILETR